MTTFQYILISPSSIPKSDLVFTHSSSCYDPNINFSCPKKITSSCPIIHLVMTQYQLLLSQKTRSLCPMAPEADMNMCICCCDSLAMELVRLTCCKKTIHRQCLLAYLGTNSQCCYCRCPVDMEKVMEYETIDRSLPKPLTPVNTPKCDLQQMLMDEKTPLRDAD